MGSKLVRDRIPEIMMEQNGKAPETHVATEEEYYERLKTKLKEEVAEFCADGNIEELADIMEVVYAISKFNGKEMHELENMRKEKASKRGSFSKRIILDKMSGD